MSITVKNHKNVYAPAEGQIEQVSIEVDFSKENNAVDYYKCGTIQENVIIHSIALVCIELITSSNTSEINIAISGGALNTSIAKDVSTMLVGGGLAMVPMYQATTTVDFVGESAETTIEGQISYPILTDTLPLDFGFEVAGDAVVSGKVKIKALISKAL